MAATSEDWTASAPDRHHAASDVLQSYDLVFRCADAQLYEHRRN